MSFVRGEIAKCPSGHSVLFLAESGKSLTQEQCDLCEQKSDKNVLPKTKTVELKYSYYFNRKYISTIEVTGPYRDGSYIINHVGLLNVKLLRYYGRLKNNDTDDMLLKKLDGDYLLSLAEKKCDGSMCIALYDADPDFWLKRDVKGPGDLLDNIVAGFEYSPWKDLRKQPDEEYIKKIMERFGFNVLLYICKDDTQTFHNYTCEKPTYDTLKVKLVGVQYSKY